MKKILLIVAGLMATVFLPGWVAADPVAVVESPVYTFESAPEGVKIHHAFVIKNSGDVDLKIENIVPP